MPSPARNNVVPVAAALALAAAGCLAAPLLTALLGYGGDWHALRLAAVAAALLVGGVVAFWPGQAWEVRGGVLLLTAGCAALGWVLAPSGLGGMSLATAAAKRNAVRAQVATAPTFDDVSRAEYISPALAFAKEFPALGESVRPVTRQWGDAAAEQLVERYRSVRPDDASAVHAVMNRAALLTAAIPETTDAVAAGEAAFADRSAAFWVAELGHVAPGHFAGYRYWVNRRAAAAGVRSKADTLAAAERAWVEQSADAAIARADHLRLFMPSRGRDELVRACADLRSLADASPATADLCRAAQQKVFAHALARSQAEAQAFIDAGAYDRAAEIARTHAGEWAEEAPLVGGEAAARVARFRDGCAYLAALAARGGDAGDFAPVPRPRP